MKFVADVAILKQLNDVRVTETADAIFQCCVDQSNYNSGKWFKSGTEISQRDPRYQLIVIDNIQQLVVKSVTEEDGGRFAYVAGVESFTQADLFVNSIDVIKGLEDVTTYETATVRFEIQLSHEGAIGSWFANENPLEVRFTDCCYIIIQYWFAGVPVY